MIKSMYKQALVNYKKHFWVYLLICVGIGGTINMAIIFIGGSIIEVKSISNFMNDYPYDSTSNLILILVDYIIKPLIFLLPLLCVVTLSVKMEKVTIKSVLALIKANAIKMIGVMIMLYGTVEVVSLMTDFLLDQMPFTRRVVLLLQDTFFLLRDILPYIIPIILTLIMAEIIYSKTSVKTAIKSTITFISKNAKTITILILNALIIMLIFSALQDIVLYSINICKNTGLLSRIIYLALSFTYIGLYYLEWLVFPLLVHIYINVLFSSRGEVYNKLDTEQIEVNA